LASGYEKYDAIKDHIAKLEEEHHATFIEHSNHFNELRQKEAEGAKIHREVFLMKKHLKNQSTVPPIPVVLLNDDPFPPGVYTPVTEPLAKNELLKGQGKYTRYFKEREESVRFAITKTKLGTKRITTDMEPILKGIKELSLMHTEFRAQLGINSSDEIENLGKPWYEGEQENWGFS